MIRGVDWAMEANGTAQETQELSLGEAPVDCFSSWPLSCWHAASAATSSSVLMSAPLLVFEAVGPALTVTTECLSQGSNNFQIQLHSSACHCHCLPTKYGSLD